MTATSTPLLLCAATRWEAEPLASALGLKKTRDGRWEGVVSGRSVELVQTGMGPEKTLRSLDAVSNESFSMAFSVGFAGALQPKMASGDIVFDVRGLDAELPPLAREIALVKGLGIHFGKIAHSDEVLATPRQKRALGEAERASAVDMETRALRAWAEARALPVYAVRVVLDALDDSLPADAPEGEGFASLARFALEHAFQLPQLMALGLRQKRAIGRLSDFLKELLPKL